MLKLFCKLSIFQFSQILNRKCDHALTHIYDLLIIGGGPVGLFTAYFASMRNADVAIIESLPQVGGQANALFPEKEIYDIGGIPKIKAKQLIQQQLAQLELFQPEIKLSTTVDNIIEQADGNLLVTTNHGELQAKAVIIAIGTGSFAPRKLNNVYDPALEDNGQVTYFVKNLADFADQNVMVAGGGDSAVDWALALENVAQSVTIIHRRDQFRGLESSVQKLRDSTVKIMTPYLLNQVTPAADQLQIDLKKVKTDDHQVVAADKLLINYGFVSDSRLLRQWQLGLAGSKIKVNTKMETNRPKVYAVGDAVTYPGKLDLIAVGYAEAPIAVTTALQTIYPEKIQPLHSTSLFN